MYIDVMDFTKNYKELNGNIDLSSFERATQIYDKVRGTIMFTLKGAINDKNMAILQLAICGKITALCQTCLNEVILPIDGNLIIPVFSSDKEFDSAVINDSTECDGIVARSHFDILNLIEDEFITLLPIAPKHEICPK